MGCFTLIGGAPGVGKTTVAPLVAKRLERCAWIDADDLWRIEPFEVTERTRALVETNLVHNARQFLAADYPHVFAIWVLHRTDLIERLVEAIRPFATATSVLHLTATPDVVRERRRAQGSGSRSEVERALERRDEIEALPYPTIDTTNRSPEQVADAVCAQLSAISMAAAE